MVDLLLFGWLCCWLNCLLNLFLAHKEGNIIFRIIAFGSLSQHNDEGKLKRQEHQYLGREKMGRLGSK